MRFLYNIGCLTDKFDPTDLVSAISDRAIFADKVIEATLVEMDHISIESRTRDRSD